MEAKYQALKKHLEEAVFSSGFKQVRVRDHGLSARIEVNEVELNRFLEPDMRKAVVSALKNKEGSGLHILSNV